MPMFNPRASRNIERQTHPDIDPATGDFRWDADLPLEHREFLRLRQDTARWNAFMNGVAARQSREPWDVQEALGGRVYEGDSYWAYRQYLQDLQMTREYNGHDNEITSRDVEAMSPEEYDRFFDERGQVREGYTYRPTDRDVQTGAEAGIERFSRGELGSNQA